MEKNIPILAKHFQVVLEARCAYYSLQIGDVEITMEPCLDGYDVGLYRNETKALVYPKIQCHHATMELAKAFAVSAANRLWQKWCENSNPHL